MIKRRKKSKGFSLDNGKSSYRKFNKRQAVREFLNWSLFILISAILGYGIVTFGVQTVRVNGPSMEATLFDGDVVLLNKIIYKVKDVKRYDIVAVKQVGSNAYYDVKRVVGLPGETVQIVGGKLFVNNKELSNLPFDETILTCGIANEPVELNADEYFVIGDNVNNSEDSRYSNYGNILSSEIKGKIFYIIRPSEHKGKIK